MDVVADPGPARPAVTAAVNGAQWWGSAVQAQRAVPSTRLEHADFYEVAAELVATLRSFEDLTEVLARQVGGYGAGRALRDDTGADPAARLVRAVGDLAALRIALGAAVTAAERFWSAVGHIGLDLEPDEFVSCDLEEGQS